MSENINNEVNDMICENPINVPANLSLKEQIDFALQNGRGYYKINYNNTAYGLIIGDDPNSNTGLTFTGYGSGGPQDLENLFNYYNKYKNNTISFVDLSGNYARIGEASTAEVSTTIAEELNNYNSNNFKFIPLGYSSTTDDAIIVANLYAKNNENKKTYLLLVEPSPSNGALSDSSITDAVNAGVIPIHISGNGKIDSVNRLLNESSDYIDILITAKDSNGNVIENWDFYHGFTYRVVCDSGYGDISTGTFDFNKLVDKEYVYGNKVYKVNCTFTIKMNGEIKEVTADELNSIMNNEISYGKYELIGDKANVSIDELIKSDELTTSNFASVISGILNSSVINNGSVSISTIDSDTLIPSSEPSIFNLFFDTCRNLFDKIYIEINNLDKIGKKFSSLDSELNEDIIKYFSIPGINNIEPVKSVGENFELGSDYNIEDYDKILDEYRDDNEKSNEDEGSTSPSTTFPQPSYPSSGSHTSPSNPSTPTENNPNENPPQEQTPSESKPENNPNENPSQEQTPSESKPENNPNENPSQEQKPSESIPENNTNSKPSQNKPSNSSSSNKTPSNKPSNQKPSTPSNDKPPIVDIPSTPEPEEPINPETPIVPEEPVIPETPIVPEEPVIPETPIVPEEPIVQPSSDTSGNALKTIGILSGVGAAVGAGAYATNKIIENRQNKEESKSYEDYNYDNDINNNEEETVVETESYDDQITPFTDKYDDSNN